MNELGKVLGINCRVIKHRLITIVGPLWSTLLCSHLRVQAGIAAPAAPLGKLLPKMIQEEGPPTAVQHRVFNHTLEAPLGLGLEVVRRREPWGT